MKVQKLVIDTAAFLRNVPLWEYADEFYTVPDVIAEIKDRQTKHLINSLPIELKIQSPSPSSLKFIIDFVKKTGDYASLSLADIKVLALTYELDIQAVGSNEHLRQVPLECRTTVIANKPSLESSNSLNIEGFYMPKEESEGGTSKFDDAQSTDNFISDEIDRNFSDLRKNVEAMNLHNLTFSQLNSLNNHLMEFSYVGGYMPSNEDVIVKEALSKSFPIIREILEISDNLLATGNGSLIFKLYNTLFLDISSGGKTFSSKNDCESYRNLMLFMYQFSSLPYLLRWFFHMQACYEETFFSISSDADSLSSHLKNLLKNDETKELNSSKIICSINEEAVTGDSIIEEKFVVLEEEHSDDSAIEVNMGDETIEADDCYDEIENSEDVEESYDENEVSENDEEGWITPSNLKNIKNRIPSDDINEEIHTACITSDYSVQNTLKHIGLKVIGVDGKIIHNLRTFILRCYACFKTTDKMDLLFCKNCGNKTLKKVAVTSNPDGTQRIWISTKRPINIRGTKFSLPKPRGGKHAINPILVADQREAQQRASKLAKMKNDPLNDDYITGNSPFTQRDVYSRSAQLGITYGKKQHRGLFYWEQRNPNVPMKKKSGRKK